MMEYAPFCVAASLQTPVILNPDAMLTLDSLLGAAIFTRTADALAAHRDIPLQVTDGIFHGSAAFLNSVILKAAGAGFKRGIQPVEEMWAPAYQTGMSKDKVTGREFPNQTVLVKRVEVQRKRYKTELDSYEAFAATQVSWFGCGDIEAVRDLMSEIHFVGKKTRQGWGQVVQVSVEEIEIDFSLSRTRRGATRPMRPVPVGLWTQWGHALTSNILVRDCAVRPPYFTGAKVRSAVPSSRDLAAS